jgi:hypothetical protein
MSAPVKKENKDTTIIGDRAAAQPLSGTNIVTDMRIKGFSGMAVTHVEETKKKAS